MTLNEPRSKQRKIACDLCKKRKIRCKVVHPAHDHPMTLFPGDGDQNPGARCTNCKTARVDCSLADLMRTLAPAKEYVAALESRVEKMERFLTTLARHRCHRAIGECKRSPASPAARRDTAAK
ncbi:hypothetical protein C8F04DRAFT_450038 [Mycena alexandri]|uniref:Zn(2)-C6 fungal-type domain-containing protein n=1 Tax=Mycena alexandri TaxID=1745969 RepID=A0AAD6TFS9_9AGAR|nr:hypothetical protein C8F04DRAFT_450038 [Mycena alexandri]